MRTFATVLLVLAAVALAAAGLVGLWLRCAGIDEKIVRTMERSALGTATGFPQPARVSAPSSVDVYWPNAGTYEICTRGQGPLRAVSGAVDVDMQPDDMASLRRHVLRIDQAGVQAISLFAREHCVVALVPAGTEENIVKEILSAEAPPSTFRRSTPWRLIVLFTTAILLFVIAVCVGASAGSGAS